MASTQLQEIIRQLKDAAERFSRLYEESQAAIAVKGRRDWNTCVKKLNERAQLLIDLEYPIISLTYALKGDETTIGGQIRGQLSYFSFIAKEAKNRRNIFTLRELLAVKGSAPGEKNQLETLIEDLESEWLKAAS